MSILAIIIPKIAGIVSNDGISERGRAAIAGRMAIINHLSREMGARRLSVQDVARMTRLSYGTVYELYRGRSKRVDLETLNRLCKALGVSVGDILEYVEEEGS